MEKKKILGITAVVLLFSLVIGLLPTLADTDDTAVGSFTLNATPSVSGVDFQDDSYTPVSALDPDASTWWRLNFTVTSSATLDDIKNITIWIYDDSDINGNYNDSSYPDNGINKTKFNWIEDTDVWSVEDEGSMTLWDCDTGNSDDPGADPAETTFEFSMRFQISYAARYAASDWNASVHAYDDDSPTAEVGYDAESALVTMNEYFNISFSAATYTWGSDIEPNSENNTHGALSFTVLANNNWEIQINGTDFNTSGESDVDIEANNILALDRDGSEDGESIWVRNTIAIVTWTGSFGWDNQGPMTNETGMARNVYIFLNPGVLFVVGKVWQTWTTVWVQSNT